MKLFTFFSSDYASQAAINPCEALVSDMLAGRAGGEAGFTVYSGMLSVGACLGYLLTALDWGALGWLGAGEHTALLLVLVLYTACLGRYRISYVNLKLALQC